MRSYNGYIRWFDNLTGIGFVTVPELGRDIKVHWSADKRIVKLKPKNKSLSTRPKGLFVRYENMDLVKVKIIFDSHYEQVSLIEKHKWIKYKDLVSDIILKYLSDPCTRSEMWDDFILNNIISLTERRIK